ncbi:oxalate transporter [Pyrrhoderma noxium]|uniref:Oxalate transporter n=1 Tax=Pyrrhoderma noxium TaxID=2282107 RepID=A0A286UAC6_9AGAM|nr:oxalate transporter [Pyrrhoderma noxium]
MTSPSPPHYASVVGSASGSASSSGILQHPNANGSQYTLATLNNLYPTVSSHNYGATMPMSPNGNISSRRILLNACVKMAALFIVSTVLLGGTLWLALPPLESEDRQFLRVPKSFSQLQELNYLLKKYRDIYPIRVVICYVTTYLFLQAFSLPGSMYLSILGGAVWGVPIALPLACTCVATGATLCYLISAALGPALLTLPKWSARLDKWSTSIAAQRSNLLSYLIVLRIAPFPPHWVVNVLAPHLRIGIPVFWISTFLGILGVSVIHTTIGGGLDDMTSAADFHLISWRNALGLSAVVVGVLIPVGLRYALSRRVGPIALTDDDSEEVESGLIRASEEGAGDFILEQGPQAISGKGKSSAPLLVLLSDSEDDGDDDLLDEEEDEILLAGPSLIPESVKGKEPDLDSRNYRSKNSNELLPRLGDSIEPEKIINSSLTDTEVEKSLHRDSHLPENATSSSTALDVL